MALAVFSLGLKHGGAFVNRWWLGRCFVSGMAIMLGLANVAEGSERAVQPIAPIPLFGTVAPSSTVSPLLGQAAPSRKPTRPWIRHQHQVTITPEAIRTLTASSPALKTEVMMDLFAAGSHVADLKPQARNDRSSAHRTHSWSGKLAQVVDSEVTMVVKDQVLVGSIRYGHTLYEIKPLADSRYELTEIDANALPSDHYPVPVSQQELDAADQSSGVPGITQAPGAAADTGNDIDVMVVYTTAAKNKNGGQTGMEVLIDLGISLANQAFINSQIGTKFRLVHTAEVSYAESGNYSTDLSRLRSTNDGFMDEVHAWRNTYKADLVALIEDNLGGPCGVAYVMSNVSASFANYAFSVTEDSCISGYTLAHELGHNMGSAHDRAEGGTGAYPYSFGHKEAGKYRTIMAYGCTPACTRINHFSNPNVQYQGWPTGIDHNVDTAKSADNARAFTNALSVVANFRNSGDTQPPPPPGNLRIIDP
jgi:hypothetical protein